LRKKRRRKKVLKPHLQNLDTGSSVSLDAVECAAWQDLYKATNGPKWHRCSDARSDPCSCYSGGEVICKTYGTSVAHITGMRLQSNDLHGTIPSSLAKLSEMSLLWLYDNRLTGLVPSLPFAQYTNGECRLDAPSACTKPSCNHFKCPLPAGHKQCTNGTDPGVHCK
jgi:hypothetical protein